MTQKNGVVMGKVVAVRGGVVDVKFPAEHLPEIYDVHEQVAAGG